MLKSLDPSKLIVRRAPQLKALPSGESLAGMFGRIFSDHMLVADWNDSQGWGPPRIEPYGDIAISPAASSLQYALACFEGMKAYRSDKVRLFRPELNARRMNSSLRRLALPEIDETTFVELIKKFVQVDQRWVLEAPAAGYLRPCVVATDAHLGVGKATAAKFYALMCPVGKYFSGATSVYADQVNTRAWPGGTGYAKIGANYGPTIQPQVAAQKFGASQVLYCRGRVTEVGSMNIFVVWETHKGLELATPSLQDDILPGVTRRSILEMCDNAVERDFSLDDLRDAHQNGTLKEVFGVGTAAIISPIKTIYTATDPIELPVETPVADDLVQRISNIHYGRDADYAHWTPHI